MAKFFEQSKGSGSNIAAVVVKQVKILNSITKPNKKVTHAFMHGC